MALKNTPLDKIAESHVADLIAAQVMESLHIEYKRAAYGAKDEDRREFLADISSFANTAGGDLVIGVDEKDGVPIRLTPLADVATATGEIDRLDKMARSGIDAPIAGLQMRAVPVTGGAIIVIRIPKSFLAPHRVVYQNSNRFWARSTASPRKYQPTVGELRHQFLATPALSERVQRVRLDRVAKNCRRRTANRDGSSRESAARRSCRSAGDVRRRTSAIDGRSRASPR